MGTEVASLLEDFERVGACLPTPIPPFDVDAYARDSESRLRPQPERATMSPLFVEARLTSFALRVEVLTSALQIGATSREEAARLARAEIRSVERAAQGTPYGPLRLVLGRLRALVEELGGIAGESDEEPIAPP
jgi:hypothetical protein